ncbi:glycosyltransferase [Vibrio ezurae]|uniref:Uncharacterized protein n=1 Tax=Vibrio ezurae NBRC 102218 TaxID=1219080 RepID=U3B2F9_9VIBR|nr:glycosyltransferase [Vibrio ezurae]GAD79632.1 hypothetical protein VEZ01S_19_00470 [Vibrio ezurae NBRC 102218]
MKKLMKKLIKKYMPKKSASIFNVGCDGTDKPRALICYLTDAFYAKSTSFKYNTNRLECMSIVNKFLEYGFIVDIVSCNDNFESNEEYDLVFGFGAGYRNAKLKKIGKRVLYCTEGHPEASLINELERVNYYKDRHNKKVNIVRSGIYYSASDYLIADYCVCMGSHNQEYIIDNLNIPRNRLFDITPTAIQGKVKSKFSGKRNILWLGSNGLVHKGLDVLIEAVNSSHNSVNLHVCGVNKKELKKICQISEKIIVHGLVDVNSSYFEGILDDCDFIALASCSEGVATGVLTGIKSGLIPITTISCGIPHGIKKFTLHSYKVNDIKENLLSIVSLDDDKLIDMYDYNSAFVRDKFNLEHYNNQLSEILDVVVA